MFTSHILLQSHHITSQVSFHIPNTATTITLSNPRDAGVRVFAIFARIKMSISDKDLRIGTHTQKSDP